MVKMQNHWIKSQWGNKVYRFWGAPGTKDSRERTADQTLGTASSRSIVKDKVLVTLKEWSDWSQDWSRSFAA